MGVDKRNIYKVSWMGSNGLIQSAYVPSVSMDSAAGLIVRSTNVLEEEIFQVTVIAWGDETTPGIYWTSKGGI